MTSFATYFTKLKVLWDELASYNDLSIYSCNVVKNLEEHKQKGKVMQFFISLNDSYSTTPIETRTIGY